MEWKVLTLRQMDFEKLHFAFCIEARLLYVSGSLIQSLHLTLYVCSSLSLFT